MRKLYIFGLIGLAAVIIGLAWAEQITLSTYYPAPYGVYRDFKVARNATFATETDPATGELVGRVGIGTTSPSRNLEVHDASSQSEIIVSGVSDSGATYSALYLNNENSDPLVNSWVIGHRKDIGLPTEESLQIGKWNSNTHIGVISLQPNGNVGIGTAGPNTPAPNNQPGNLDVNDIYLRSTDQWVSGGAGGAATPGTWCGLRMSAHTVPVFTCNGYDPMVSCPSGYHSVAFANMGPLGGTWYTCVKD